MFVWRRFVYDCGVIGLCPLCTRATPLTGVWPCWPVVEWRSFAPVNPLSQQGTRSLLAGGFTAQGFLHSPTGQQDHTPAKGVALVHVG